MFSIFFVFQPFRFEISKSIKSQSLSVTNITKNGIKIL